MPAAPSAIVTAGSDMAPATLALTDGVWFRNAVIAGIARTRVQRHGEPHRL